MTTDNAAITIPDYRSVRRLSGSIGRGQHRIAMYAASPRKHKPTIRSVMCSTRSRRSTCRSDRSNHSDATLDVTSITLSMPKPTSDTLPAMPPATTEAAPSSEL